MSPQRLVLRTSTLLLVCTALLLLASGAAGADEAYRLSGPYTHENLTIFLLHGKDSSNGKALWTLQDALAQHKVIVHEQGTVNALSIENISPDVEIFIQSGDIVKGGKQDRLIASDLIVPPRSGVISVTSFCVERQRWSQRGDEVVSKFSSSTRQLPSKRLKLTGGNLGVFGGQQDFPTTYQGQLGNLGGQFGNLGGQFGLQGAPFGNRGGQLGLAAGGLQLGSLGGQWGLQGAQFGNLGGQFGNLGGQFGLQGGQFGNLSGQFGFQGGVWQAVASVQKKLRKNLATDVASKVSRTSLQLTLENNKLQEATDKYLSTLSRIIDGHSDVIGYAFAINGEINSADVYASTGLFKTLWPKLLHANAVEAIAEQQQDRPFQAVTAEAVADCLKDAEQGQKTEKDVTQRTRLLMRETDKTVFVETCDRARGQQWIHRSYVIKDKVPLIFFRILMDTTT
jgi:hypothetical protein